MRDVIRLSVSVLLLSLVTGCFDLEQHLMIHEDGSGMMAYHYSVDEDMFPLMKQTQKSFQDWQNSEESSPQWMLNRKTAAEFFKTSNSELKTYEQYTERGRTHVQIRVALDSVQKALQSGRFGEFNLEQKEEMWFFTASLVNDFSEKLNIEQQRRLNELCKDVLLRFSITVPGTVQSATGKMLTPSTVIWKFGGSGNTDFLNEVPEIHLSYK